MRGVLLVAVALGLAACGGGSTTADVADGSAPEVAFGVERLPDVDVEPLAGGEPVSLADLDGPAVVNLWATWCAPCRREIPDFEAVHVARGDEVRFVGVNIGEDAGRAGDFLTEVGATYDQYLDTGGYVVTELRTTAMPVTLVIDASGDIVTRHLGPMDQDDLDGAIDLALASGS